MEIMYRQKVHFRDKFKNEAPDLNKICRLCFKEKLPLFSVNGKMQGDNTKILTIIFNCFNIMIENIAKICEECLVKLDIFVTLRKEVTKIDRDYKLYLQELPRPSIELVEIFDGIFKREIKLEPGETMFAEELHIIDIIDDTSSLICNESIKSVFHNEENQVVENEAVAKPHPQKKKLKMKKCIICQIEIDNLKEHLEKNHSGMELQCNLCPEIVSFETSMDLYIHLSYHDPKKKYKCQYCFKRFTMLRKKNEHKKTHSKEEMANFAPKKEVKELLPCSFCGKLFRRKRDLNKHELRFHKSNEEVHCGVCNNRYTSNTELKLHMRKHTNEKPLFICEYCGKSFRIKPLLVVHTRLHTKEMPYHCDICNRDFRTRQWFVRHKKKGIDGKCARTLANYLRQQGTNRSTVCFVCDINLRVQHYQQHIETEHPDEAYKCKLCLEKLENFEAYKSHHKAEHYDESAPEIEVYFPCNHCQCVFHSQSKFLRHQYHQSYHNRGILWKCKYCERQFRNSGNMLKHLRVVHLRKLNFKCDVCYKSFGQRNQLRVHKRVHTGEKPEICKICNISYSDPSTLWKHNKKHHTAKL